MAAAETTEMPLIVWLLFMLSSIISLVPAMNILIRERRKRAELPLFASKYLSFFSYSVIYLVPVSQANGIVYPFPGICYISQNVGTHFHALVWCSLECYQLSRLYYCFSADKVHSNRGCPTWVFVLFVSLIGVTLIGSLFSNYTEFGLTTQCGILRTGDAYFVRYYQLEKNVSSFLYGIIILLMAAIDLLILALYWWKARSLSPRNSQQDGQQDEQNKAYIRIRLILNRIIILSFFYTIAFLYFYLISIIWAVTTMLLEGNEVISDFIPNILWPVVAVCISYSIYLMQEHNTKEYIRFLSILNKYKLYLCCCCCYKMVRDQYQFVLDNEEKPHKEHSPKTETTITTMDTRDISKYGAGVEERHHVTGVELSIATKTERPVVEEKEIFEVVYLEDTDYQMTMETK